MAKLFRWQSAESSTGEIGEGSNIYGRGVPDWSVKGAFAKESRLKISPEGTRILRNVGRKKKAAGI